MRLTVNLFQTSTAFREFSTKVADALSELFSSVIDCFSFINREPVLRPLPGRVHNAGNTCTLSVFLQEVAALPEYYSCFNLPLSQKTPEESPKQTLQRRLTKCVATIRDGGTVSSKQIHRLAVSLLMFEQFRVDVPMWRLRLYKWVPALFSLPHLTIDRVFVSIYNQIFSEEFAAAGATIVQFGRVGFEGQVIEEEDFFRRDPTVAQIDSPQLLCRDNQPTLHENVPEEFDAQGRLFQLKLVYALETSWVSNHVVVYRRMDEGSWVYCSDTDVHPVGGSIGNVIDHINRNGAQTLKAIYRADR